MTRVKYVVILMSLLPFLLTGCWDNGEVQEINYLTAFGIDFRDGEYYIYAQMLDYESISGPEGSVPSSQPPIWLGKGRGKTLAEATKKLYTTSQQKLSWSQITALVLSESMLTHERIRDVIDKSNRTEDISYTKWVYGTKENIEELFTSTPFVGMSPLRTLLHQPMINYSQNSFIHPLQYVDFLVHYREKAGTVVLPSLAITTSNWTEGMKEHPILEIDGAFMLKDNENKGWLKLEDILGIRWLKGPATRATILVGPMDDPVGLVRLVSPRSVIGFEPTNDGVKYRLKVKVIGKVVNLYKQVPIDEFKKMTRDVFKKELISTFRKTTPKHGDPYQLSLSLYQKNPKLWNKLQKEGKSVTAESLDERDIQVDIDLRLWGARKHP